MNNKEHKNYEYQHSILDILNMIEANFKDKYKKGKLNSEQLYTLMQDLKALIEFYNTLDIDDCTKIIKQKYIPTINLLMRLEKDKNRQIEYLKDLENAYRIGAKNDFHCFLVYYEWESDDKVFETRYKILQSYVYYLNEMAHNPDFEVIVVNLPSGYGKTRVAKLYEAWRLGLDSKGTYLSLCSNDTVVKGGSRSVIDIIKDERYGNVFPHLSYKNDEKGLFLKETDGEWKLKTCKLMASYYASTTGSNVVGQRASLSIHIDDLYADYKEALDENLNMYYYNKFVTVWRKRFVQNKTPQIIISGTMWSPTDFMVKIIDLMKSENKFYNHPKFKYTYISEDFKKVIIQVPALDPVTDMSTCEELRSTEALRRERKSMETYLWETNFQQNPTTPEGLDFDWKNLKLYEEKPEDPFNIKYAVIDGTRKSGKDFFSMPIYQQYYDDYALIDCIFTKTATSELIDDIVDKIIEHHIIRLVIETNVDGGLKKVLEGKFKEKGVDFCIIEEKYNTVPKKIRIEAEKGVIVKRIWFPSKNLIDANSDMSKFMQNFTLYNSDGRNKNDDAPDSNAMFTSEIISNKNKSSKAVVFKRIF